MKFRKEHKINIPILVTTKESYYVMPHTPWYKKPLWIIFIGFLIYGSYIGIQVYKHWEDPAWCSPWFKAEVCEAAEIQRGFDNRAYNPPPAKTETSVDPPTEAPIDTTVDEK